MDNLDINISGRNLTRVESCKYYGNVFDFNSKFEKHVEYLVNKTRYFVFLFVKRYKMQTETIGMLYCAFFSNIIDCH